jgi:hypothetical protein
LADSKDGVVKRLGHDLLRPTHLEKADEMLEYRAPEFKDTNKGEAVRPPIWITMIGQNGDLVPLQLFTNYETDDHYVWPPPNAAPAGEIKKMEQPFPGTAFLALTAVCVLALLMFYYAFRRLSPQLFWPLPEGHEEGFFWSGMALRCVCFLALGILLLPVAHLCGIQLKNGGRYGGGTWWLSVPFVLGFFYLGLVGPALLLLYLPVKDAAGFFGRHRWKAVIACAVVLGAALVAWHPWEVLLFLPVFLLGLVGPALLSPLVPRPAPSSVPPPAEAPSPTPTPAAGNETLAPGGQATGVPASSSFWQRRGVWAGGALVVSVDLLVWRLSEPPNSWEAFFFYRSLHFASGVSLLLPLSFLCAVFFCWALFQMKGRYDCYCFEVPSPYPDPETEKRFPILKEVWKVGQALTNEVSGLIVFAKGNLVWLVILLLLTVVGSWQLWFRFLPTVEGCYWTLVFFYGFTVGGFLVAFNLLRLLALWGSLKNLCHEITLIPMMGAFSRLPAKLTSIFGGSLGPPRPRLSHLRVPIHQLRLLGQETKCLLHEDGQLQAARPSDGTAISGGDAVRLSAADLERVNESLQQFEDVLASQFPELALAEEGGGDVLRTDQSDEDRSLDLRKQLSDRSQMLLDLLRRFWARRPVDEAFGAADSKTSSKLHETAPAAPHTGDVSRAESPGEEPAVGRARFARWVELAEGFVATQVVIYISQFFVQLRSLVWSMVICSTLLLLAVTSYPFQPQRFILFTMLALTGAVVAAILYVLYMINRDELVSRIARTTPNRFTPDIGFFSSIFTYIVPVVSVVALQVFGAFRFMLEPILRVLR